MQLEVFAGGAVFQWGCGLRAEELALRLGSGSLVWVGSLTETETCKWHDRSV